MNEATDPLAEATALYYARRRASEVAANAAANAWAEMDEAYRILLGMEAKARRKRLS